MSKRIWNLVLVTIVTIIMITGCATEDKSVKKEQDQVSRQQLVYSENQPPPFFEWSMSRDLWIQFYRAQNEAVSTWSYIVNIQGKPIFETPSQGIPIPLDTQLTNPLKTVAQHIGNSNWIDGVVCQAEPNGLFTSPNTRATIIMSLNDDGTVSPVYSEPDVVCYPYPVKWDKEKEMFVRVEGTKPAIALTVNTRKP